MQTTKPMISAGMALLLGAMMSGCAANKPTYSVVVPLAQTDVFVTSQQIGDQKFEVRYKTDAEGSRITQRVMGTGTYVGGGRESYDSVYSEAKTRMIRDAIDQVNGVFITAKTEVVQKSWQSGGQSSGYEDLKDETISKLVGTAKVMGEPRCERQASEAGTTKIHCQGDVSVPVVEVITTQL